MVLLGRHDGEGALGWVINGKEIAPVGELLRGLRAAPGAAWSCRTCPGLRRLARVGGPVAPATGWLVYRRTADPPCPASWRWAPTSA